MIEDPKSLYEKSTFSNFYGKGRTKYDVVMICSNENHSHWSGSDRIPVNFGEVLTFARSTEEHELGNIQTLGEGKALTKGDFKIPTEVCFVQYSEPISKYRDDSNGVQQCGQSTGLYTTKIMFNIWG